MHLLIPFAHCSSEGCDMALRTLKLPQLQKLLSSLAAQGAEQSDPLSLSAPHERALARALALPLADGMIPWAALQARQTLAAGGAWGFITPCHWKIGSQHVVMSGSALTDFSEQDARALLGAMQPYFAEDGISLHYQQPRRWLAQSELFDGLATASLDRASGHDVSDWLPTDSRAGKLRRLQSEMQMLLYNHPVNESRSERGLPVVNSFWLSGTGALAPALSPAADAAPQVADSLREAALNEDWPAWASAWEQLDATEGAALLQALQRGEAVQLTLCGERATQTFASDLSWRAKRSNPLAWIATACGLAMTGTLNLKRSLMTLFKSPSVTRFLEPL
ncbi:MAG: phosphoglycerate mutase [Burkholderiales bacterium]|nr:phosphoglycerate mutase [Burkholderiales bacterium]